jgi:hypothetical protein
LSKLMAVTRLAPWPPVKRPLRQPSCSSKQHPATTHHGSYRLSKQHRLPCLLPAAAVCACGSRAVAVHCGKHAILPSSQFLLCNQR